MGTLRVPATITWAGSGSPGVNVWSVRTTGAFPPFDELDAALTAIVQFYTSLKSYFRPATSVTVGPDIVDRDTLVDASRPAQVVASTGTPNPAPPSLQLCIGWRTSLRARRGMGRTFIGPLSSAQIATDGSPQDTMITAVSSAATALIAASDTANGWGVGVWGLQDKGAYDASGVLLPGQPHVHRDFTGFKIRDQFAVLRSRRD